MKYNLDVLFANYVDVFESCFVPKKFKIILAEYRNISY